MKFVSSQRLEAFKTATIKMEDLNEYYIEIYINNLMKINFEVSTNEIKKNILHNYLMN